MKDFFDRLGLYDYLGIWWPGTICLTYYLFTLQAPLTKLFQSMGMEKTGFQQGHLVLILYTVIAYLIGVILHEAGKLFSDHIFKLTPEKCLEKAFSPKKLKFPFRRVRNNFATAIKDIIQDEAYKEITFHKANYGLRFNRNADKKKIESYHAVYALSRSLFLCFFLHLFAEVAAYYDGSITCRNAIIMSILDVFLIILFWIRTVRYYYSWNKNLIIHYYVECKSEKKATSDSEETCAVEC